MVKSMEGDLKQNYPEQGIKKRGESIKLTPLFKNQIILLTATCSLLKHIFGKPVCITH